MRTWISRLPLLLALGMGQPALAEEATYGEMVRAKLASGITNMAFGLAELPKNVINTSNEVNVLLGATGGVLKGTLHTLGRLLAGTLDFITFPVPSQPITHPAYVWQQFGTDTTYGPFFDMSRQLSEERTRLPAAAPRAP